MRGLHYVLAALFALVTVSAAAPTPTDLCRDHDLEYAIGSFVPQGSSYVPDGYVRPGYEVSFSDAGNQTNLTSNKVLGAALLFNALDAQNVLVGVVMLDTKQALLPSGQDLIILCTPPDEGDSPNVLLVQEALVQEEIVEIPEWDVLGFGALAIASIGLLSVRRH